MPTSAVRSCRRESGRAGACPATDFVLGLKELPGGAGVLALDADGVHALLHVPGLVDHQHRVRVAEMLHDVAAQIITHPVGVPAGPGQQMLHPVRVGIAGERSTSSSSAADRPTARARTRGPAGGSRPGRTGPPPGPTACRLPLPTPTVLRCRPRPPLDHLMSTQRTRITRWPPHVRDRHAARSRTTAGVLGGHPARGQRRRNAT
jgi:hypothetical protein